MWGTQESDTLKVALTDQRQNRAHVTWKSGSRKRGRSAAIFLNKSVMRLRAFVMDALDACTCGSVAINWGLGNPYGLA